MKRRLFSLLLLISLMITALPVTALAEEGDSPVFEGTLKTSDRCVEMIKSIEGFQEKPMWDYAQSSVGYGCSTEYAEKFGFDPNHMTEEEASELLLFVLSEMEVKLDKFLDQIGIEVNQTQYDALMSFTYNLGSKWMKADSRLGEVLASDAYTVNELASAMGVYCHVTSNGQAEVLDLLVDRRIREIKLFLYGAYELTDVPQKFCVLRYDAGDGAEETDIGFYQVGEPYQILFSAEPTEDTAPYFAGWYTRDGEQITASTIVEDSQTVVARWSDTPVYPEELGLYEDGVLYVTDFTDLPGSGSSTHGGNADEEEGREPEKVEPEEELELNAAEMFTDISTEQWYFKYVNALVNDGIIKGYEDGTFRPSSNVTTGEALKMIILAAGYEEPPAAESHWARGYLDFALEQGFLVSGEITDLDVPINRAMMAQLVAESLGLEDYYDFDVYADTNNVYAAILFKYEIVEGYEDGTFRPDNSLTRAELSTIVWRMLHLR